MKELKFAAQAYGEVRASTVGKDHIVINIDQPYEASASLGLNKEEATKLRDWLSNAIQEIV